MSFACSIKRYEFNYVYTLIAEYATKSIRRRFYNVGLNLNVKICQYSRCGFIGYSTRLSTGRQYQPDPGRKGSQQGKRPKIWNGQKKWSTKDAKQNS